MNYTSLSWFTQLFSFGKPNACVLATFGHVFIIPGSIANLHGLLSLFTSVKILNCSSFVLCWDFLQMLDGSQTLLPADELNKRFEQEG